jgi:hypothetical protein
MQTSAPLHTWLQQLNPARATLSHGGLHASPQANAAHVVPCCGASCRTGCGDLTYIVTLLHVRPVLSTAPPPHKTAPWLAVGLGFVEQGSLLAALHAARTSADSNSQPHPTAGPELNRCVGCCTWGQMLPLDSALIQGCVCSSFPGRGLCAEMASLCQLDSAGGSFGRFALAGSTVGCLWLSAPLAVSGAVVVLGSCLHHAFCATLAVDMRLGLAGRRAKSDAPLPPVSSLPRVETHVCLCARPFGKCYAATRTHDGGCAHLQRHACMHSHVACSASFGSFTCAPTSRATSPCCGRCI